MLSIFKFIEILAGILLGFTLVINLRNYLRERVHSSLFSVLISSLFILAVLASILEAYWEIKIYLYDFEINLSSFLVVLFLTLGFLTFLIYINYLSSERIRIGAIAYAFMSGLIVMGELLAKTNTMASIVNIIGIIGLMYLLASAVKFAYNLQINIKSRGREYGVDKLLLIYSVGLILFISGFIILLMGDVYVLSISRDIAKGLYFIGYGALLIAIIIIVLVPIRNPYLLEVNLSKPYIALFASREGNLLAYKAFKFGNQLDPSLASGIITAILNASQEIIGREMNLRVIRFEGFSIIVCLTRNIAGYFFVERPTMIISTILCKAVRTIENMIDFTRNMIYMDTETSSNINRELDKIFEPLFG